MHFAMMASAQGNRELVADFPAKGAALRKSKMMRVRRASPTEEARLLGNEPKVFFIANPARFLNRKCALVDSLGAGRAACPFGGRACQRG